MFSGAAVSMALFESIAAGAVAIAISASPLTYILPPSPPFPLFTAGQLQGAPWCGGIWTAPAGPMTAFFTAASRS